MTQERIEEIRRNLSYALGSGDLGFANDMQSAVVLGWYKMDIPELLDELERLRKENEELKQELETMRGVAMASRPG